MTLATYSIPTILGIWVAGSFLLALVWVALKTLDNYLNRRAEHRGRPSGPDVHQAPPGERGIRLSNGGSPRVFDTEELDAIRWDWIAPYDSPLQGGRKRRR